MRNKYSVMILN